MLSIPLTQNKVALVDDCDAEKVLHHKWCASKSTGNNSFYATSSIWVGGRGKTIFMHRVIMEPPQNLCVDHINGNGLDNRRANLRICSTRENLRNSILSAANTTGYKGVSFNRNAKKFQARIEFNYRSRHIGYFKTAIEAARAYDQEAIKLFGKFARLNLPAEARCSLS